MWKNFLVLLFMYFMYDTGIIHQMFSYYTPQQKGVAKCEKYENPYLLEVTWTLLANMCVSKYFLKDTVLVPYYLINHMTYIVLDNKIPYYIL